MEISIPNPIDAAQNAARYVGDAGEAASETTASVAEPAFEVAEYAAVKPFQYEAAVAKFGLQKTFDAGRAVGAATVDLAAAALNPLTHPGDPTPPAAEGLSFAETKSASDLAYESSGSKVNDVYEFADGERWKVVDVKEDLQTGFRAVALKPVDPTDTRVIVAFSGSDEGVDWVNNAQQGFGLASKQYGAAVDYANKWKATDGGDVILTGHSLGGGLASYASIKTDQPATAVNSAPLALNHLGWNPFDARRITQYYVPGEALSVLNAANPLDIRPGASIAVQGRNSYFDPRSVGSNHLLDNVAPDIAAPQYIGNFN